MSKQPKDPKGRMPRGGNAGKSPPNRKSGYGSGRDTKGPKGGREDKKGGRDK